MLPPSVPLAWFKSQSNFWLSCTLASVVVLPDQLVIGIRGHVVLVAKKLNSTPTKFALTSTL
jgi:hypothetical protein